MSRVTIAAWLLPAALSLGCGGARAQTITFEAGCSTGQTVRIGAVGDLLFHQNLQRQALTAKGDYKQFWAPVQPILSKADILYANFEGPAADGVAVGGSAVRDPGRTLDGRVYGTVPGALVFNYHPSALHDVKASGFHVVSTANNHAADRGALGIDRTIDNARRAGLAVTGTRKRDEPDAPWSTITKAKGLTVAWLACTYSTNGIPDRHGQVLNCYTNRDQVMAELQRLAADPAIDAVILTPHWGQEYAPQPMPSDRKYAREAIDAGADAVLGAHPHVLQPWEKHRTAAGREGLIVYSLGNFISNQQKPAQRSGVVALLELTKEPGARKAHISAAGFVPTWVEFTGAGHRVTEMKGDPAARGTALAATLQLLPRGNRVTSATLDNLPRPQCPEQPVAIAPPVEPLPVLALLDPTVVAEARQLAETTVPLPPTQPRTADADTSEPPMEAATAAISLPLMLPLLMQLPLDREPPPPPSEPSPRRIALRVERRQPPGAPAPDDRPSS